MATSSFEEFKKKYSSNYTGGASTTTSVIKNQTTPSTSFEEFKQKYSSKPTTQTVSQTAQPSIRSTIPAEWSSPQNIAAAKNLMNATSVRTYEDAKKYGAGNIDLSKRPIVKNEDGSISTVRSLSFNDGGKEILIPTVVNGKIVSDDEAIDHYYKTGEYLGKFNTIEEADSYAKKLHEEQEQMYSNNKISDSPTPYTTNGKFNPFELTQDVHNIGQTARQEEKIRKINEITGGQPTAFVPMKLNVDELEEAEKVAKENIEKNNKLNSIVKTPEIMKDNLRRFEDGYNFGDVTKTGLETVGDTVLTVGGTAGDIVLNAAKGVLSVPENMAKAGASAVAGVADFVGADEWANNIRRNVAYKNIYTDPIQKGIDVVDKASVTGEFVDDIASGIGQVGGTVATTYALGKVGLDHVGFMPTAAILQGAGSAATEAYQKADESVGLANMKWQDKLQTAIKIGGGGLTAGAAEGLVGMLGVGGTPFTTKISNAIISKVSGPLAKVLTKMGLSGLGEMGEEFVEYVGNVGLNNLIDKIGNVNYLTEYDGKEIGKEMLSSFIVAALTQGGTSSIQMRNIANQQISQIEKEIGRKLTPNEIKQVANNIADQLLIESEEIDVPETTQTEQIQPTNEVIPLEQQNQNTANMVQNNADVQNVVQNQPNIEQISQNNVENAPNLQKTVQSSQNDIENTILDNSFHTARDLEAEIKNNIVPESLIAGKKSTTRQKKVQIVKDYLEKKYPWNEIKFSINYDTGEVRIENIFDKTEMERHEKEREVQNNIIRDEYNRTHPKTTLEDELNLTYNEFPDEKQLKDLFEISDRIDDLVTKLDREGYEVWVEHSKASADANYIYVNTSDGTKEIRVANHYKFGSSGKEHDISIDMSDYGSKKVLLNDIEENIKKLSGSRIQNLTAKENVIKKLEQENMLPTAEQLNQPSQEMIEAAQALTLEEKQNKPKTGFMLANEGDSYKRNMFNNNVKAINDLIKAKNITTKELEDKIKQYKELNINTEENYKDIINELEKKREIAIKELEAKILQKEYELENKKDKTTKIAQTLRGQIANLKVRITNINTDYNTRIERLKNIQIKKNANTLKKNNNQIIALEKKKADLEADYINKIDRLENRNATINKLKKQVSEDRLPTRKEIKQDIITEADMESINLDDAKDLSKFIMNNTTPLRVNEKIFDRETAKRINDTFFRPIKTNEAERIRFLNKERSEIQSLGIEPRSEESEYVQIYGEGEWVNPDTGEATPYTLDDLKKQFPENWEKIKNAAEVIRGKYDAYLDAVNKELNKMGYDSIPKLKNYFRHFEETTSLLDQIGIPSKADHLPTDLNGLTSDLRPGKNFFANALSRTGKKTTYDAITGIDGYLEGVSKLMYHTEDIQKLRTFDEYIRNKYGKNADLEGLNTQEFNQRVEQIQDGHLSEYAAWLSEYTNNLAGKKSKMDRGTEEALGRRIYGTLNAVKKQVGSNLTGLNLNSALSNFISITQAGSKTSKYAMLEGFGDTVKNIFQDDGFINKSDFLTRRFGSDKLSKTTWEKMSNAGQIFMAGTDYFSANLITRSKYHEYLNKGYPENEAMKLADEFADRVMGGRALGDMPNIFNSKTLGILTQFQLENVNQFDSMFHDTKYEDRVSEQTKYDAKTWNEKIKSKLAKEKPEFYNSLSATLILGQLFAYAWAYNKVDEELTGSGGAFDPIGMIEDLIKDFTNPNISKGQAIANLSKNILDAIPYANILTGGGRVPMTDAIPNIVDLLEGESTLGSELWKVANLALPTGGGQLRKTAQAAGALIKGGDYKTNANGEKQLKFPIAQEGNIAQRIAEGAQALLFGKWATPGGQQYIEDGFKPLSAVETQGLEKAQEMDIGIKEFYDIMESIEELEIPKRKNKEGKEEAVPGARKKLIKEELNNRKELTDEQRKLLYDIFYKREL